ncbi:unnamed protein product [Rotaria socialis]|uniref:Uncharacterized protein n=1 Tax=Rotaria socialis TaxID=392032 RepID=A0A822ALF7_9BILA|nr:unnamed protein product [Rotaria socialis]
MVGKTPIESLIRDMLLTNSSFPNGTVSSTSAASASSSSSSSTTATAATTAFNINSTQVSNQYSTFPQ